MSNNLKNKTAIITGASHGIGMSMIKQLLNKTALITGASHGIGMEIGRKFLLAGANVVFSD